MARPSDERMRWRDNPNAVELGFDHYLTLIERRLNGEDVSLVQGLRRFYRDELSIDLRETQARGLMHRESSVFIDYVKSIFESEFLPNIEYWEVQGLERFLQWRSGFYRARDDEDNQCRQDPSRTSEAAGANEPFHRKRISGVPSGKYFQQDVSLTEIPKISS